MQTRDCRKLKSVCSQWIEAKNRACQVSSVEECVIFKSRQEFLVFVQEMVARHILNQTQSNETLGLRAPADQQWVVCLHCKGEISKGREMNRNFVILFE